jgi:hypothetical protein
VPVTGLTGEGVGVIGVRAECDKAPPKIIMVILKLPTIEKNFGCEKGGAGGVMCLRNFACHNCDRHLKKDHLPSANLTPVSVTVTGWYQADDRRTGDRRVRAGGLQKIYLGVTCRRRVIQ